MRCETVYGFTRETLHKLLIYIIIKDSLILLICARGVLGRDFCGVGVQVWRIWHRVRLSAPFYVSNFGMLADVSFRPWADASSPDLLGLSKQNSSKLPAQSTIPKASDRRDGLSWFAGKPLPADSLTLASAAYALIPMRKATLPHVLSVPSVADSHLRTDLHTSLSYRQAEHMLVRQAGGWIGNLAHWFPFVARDARQTTTMGTPE